MTTQTTSLLGKYAIAYEAYPEPKKELHVAGRIRERISKRLQSGKTKNTAVDKTATSSEKLTSITDGVRENLITAKTVFPFVLFPDRISIDRQKLTITHQSFFNTSSTTSMQIDDVQIAKVDVGPFFGSVHLASKYFADNLQSINFLKRSEAIKIQRLLQGYMIAHHRKIDCSEIDNIRLVNLLTTLGRGSAA